MPQMRGEAEAARQVVRLLLALRVLPWGISSLARSRLGAGEETEASIEVIGRPAARWLGGGS